MRRGKGNTPDGDALCCIRFEVDALIFGSLDKEKVLNDTLDCLLVTTFGVLQKRVH